MKKFFVSVLLFSLILVFAPSARALNSAVYFEGGSDNFSVYPGSSYSDTDLFDGFKSAMPGDTYTETIKVRNAAPEYDTVKIYLRVEAHDESANPINSDAVSETETVASMNDFLAQLNLKIYNGDSLIYNAAPNQASDNILLGEFANGASTTLTVELEVPKTLGSKYMHRSGEVDWVFLAEGYVNGEPVNPDPGDNPNPGGNTEPEPLPDEYQQGNSPFTFDSIVKYSVIFGISLIGLLVAIKIIRRQIKQNKQA